MNDIVTTLGRETGWLEAAQAIQKDTVALRRAIHAEPELGLHVRPPGMAGGIAEREIVEQEPRHTAMLHHVACGSDHDRRQAGRFEVP